MTKEEAIEILDRYEAEVNRLQSRYDYFFEDKVALCKKAYKVLREDG